LAQPDAWRARYLTAFSRYRRLDGMSVVHGLITTVDTERHTVHVRTIDGSDRALPYDALVIASGVSNGFWREPHLETLDEVNRRIDRDAAQLAAARSVAIVGGGATGVSAASNLKERYPTTDVHLFFSREQPLPGYHPKVRQTITSRLIRQGVTLHPEHRARVPAGFAGERLTTEPVEWETGQPPFQADVVLWSVGRQRPNAGFLPAAMLDPDGYVRVDAHLRVPGFANVFAVGDVAASDPNRSSARNAGYDVVAHNVRCHLTGNARPLKRFTPTAHRWGSVLGVQRDGLRVFTPRGGSVRIRPWWVEHVLFPWIVERLMYKGVRK
jgi:apoptosis-inducing factor 2